MEMGIAPVGAPQKSPSESEARDRWLRMRTPFQMALMQHWMRVSPPSEYEVGDSDPFTLWSKSSTSNADTSYSEAFKQLYDQKGDQLPDGAHKDAVFIAGWFEELTRLKQRLEAKASKTLEDSSHARAA